MKKRIDRVVTSEDRLKIEAAREKRHANKDIDFEHKSHHGAYADDEKDEPCDHIEIHMGTCVGCGRRSDDL